MSSTFNKSQCFYQEIRLSLSIKWIPFVVADVLCGMRLDTQPESLESLKRETNAYLTFWRHDFFPQPQNPISRSEKKSAHSSLKCQSGSYKRTLLRFYVCSFSFYPFFPSVFSLLSGQISSSISYSKFNDPCLTSTAPFPWVSRAETL